MLNFLPKFKTVLLVSTVFTITSLYNNNVLFVDAAALDDIANKIIKLVTKFGTVDQIKKLAMKAAPEVVNGLGAVEIANKLFGEALNVATSSQKIQGMAILTKLINDLGGPSKANQTMAKVIVPLKKKFNPMYLKAQKNAIKLKNEGQSTDVVYNSLFKTLNKKLKKKLVKKVIGMCKKAITADEWAAARKNLDPIVLFKNYGY